MQKSPHEIAINAQRAAVRQAAQQAAAARRTAAVQARSARAVAKDDAAIAGFNGHIQREISKAGNSAYTSAFKAGISAEQNSFAKHHKRFQPVGVDTLIPSVPDGTGALVITVPGPSQSVSAVGGSGPTNFASGGISSFASGSGDGSTIGQSAPSGSGSAGIPLWVKIAGGVVGVVGLYGYVKYRQVTAPFRHFAKIVGAGKALHAAVKGK